MSIADFSGRRWSWQIFPKSPKENKNSSNMSDEKFDGQYCLEKPFISVHTRIKPCRVASCATGKRTPKKWKMHTVYEFLCYRLALKLLNMP